MNTVLALQNLVTVVDEDEAPWSTISNCCGSN
ncbi:class III lanthipeptide [Amycolatopsis sp. PS_44_ISF1]|nr:class III lanthipeptide [Amycolatopsis sp. PS_44_ISF1]MDT8912305.1 class III lanthipeptide [Amycolatopsis sp. PS_44_ISF1]